MPNLSKFKYLHSHEEFFVEQGRPFEYEKNQYFVRRDDPLPWVYFLKSGLVEIAFTLSDGSKRIIGYIVPGMSFAQHRSFYEEDGGELDYRTVTPCVIYRLHRDLFLRQIKSDQRFNDEYVEQLLRTQVFLVERVSYQGENNIYKKTLRWLLFMVKYYGEETDEKHKIVIPLTQHTIGNFLHVSRESINKSLNKLISKKLISKNHKLITVNNIEELRKEIYK